MRGIVNDFFLILYKKWRVKIIIIKLSFLFIKKNYKKKDRKEK